MRATLAALLATGMLLWAVDLAGAAGRYLQLEYPPSAESGQLQLGVTYTLWIPEGVSAIRGIIVHQHGCGAGACGGGRTAAHDLHWQALAAKWDCALLGPSYHQADDQNCRLWCDPRNGSAETFLRATREFSEQAQHPELATVPWCLWGHSGGGFWSSLMQTLHPDRIVAIWFRSGTAYPAWESGEIPKPEIPAAAYAIPMICNPGAKEKGHERFDRAWTGSFAMFRAYRSQGAPIGFAPDPRTAHECGDARYLAIPFFDACLAMRLPEKGGETKPLRPVDASAAWLAEPLADQASPAAAYQGDAATAVWLPNERVAKAWSEYVATGAVGDTTAPAPPRNVRVANGSGGVQVTWDAVADLESGIGAFVILRGGMEIAQVPEKPLGRFGRPLFQAMSYHDTPEAPLPEMQFLDKSAEASPASDYRVITVNGVGLRSEPAAAG